MIFVSTWLILAFQAVVRSLELCPMDIRAQLVQNVVICGGTLVKVRGKCPNMA